MTTFRKFPESSYKFYFNRILFSVVLIFMIFLYLRYYVTPDAITFPDSKVYLNQSRQPLLTTSFFTDFKPFTTALFYKMAGSDIETIVFYQQLISVICWTFLGFSLSCFIKNKVLALLSIIVFSIAPLWWNVGGWNHLILSESIFFSLYALWIGSFFLFLHLNNNRFSFAILSIISLFLSYTKSNMSFFLVFFVLIFISLLYMTKQKIDSNKNQLFKQRKYLLIYLFIVFFIFALFLTPQFKNERQEQYNFVNVVFQRILIDEEKLNWFQEKGMPVDNNLLTWKGEWASSRERDIFNNQTYLPFLNWTLHEGKYVYAVYLASHPYYSIKSVWDNRDMVFSYNLYRYTKRPPKDPTLNSVSIIWNPGYWTLIIAALLSIVYLIINFFFKKDNYLFLFQSAIFVALLLNAIMVFHADAMEVQRHSLLLAVGVYILFICGIFFTLDNFIQSINITKKLIYSIASGIAVLIFVYLFFVLAFNVPNTYTIDIGSHEDIDASKDAYLRDLTIQERITPRMAIKEDTFRNMTDSPVYFDIYPANNISNDTRIYAELKFKGDADLDIGLYKKYAWKPLYWKRLDNYSFVERFNDISIYTRNNSKNYSNHVNINEWISDNIPKNSKIGLYDFELSPDIMINRDIAYKNVDMEINQTFRGSISFQVYINSSLNLTLGKRDMNWYEGSDEYSVELYDANGSMIFNDSIPDDGIIDNSSKRKPPQFKTFFREGIRQGLYELRLVEILTGNKSSDSTLTDIKINTDKIFTKGTILPLNPGKLFLEIEQNSTLKFHAWHDNAVQNITIHGIVDREVIINKSLLGKWVTAVLPGGSYTMSFKGDLYISGANFAFTEASLTPLDNYRIDDENSDWVIISNYIVEKDNKGWITAKKIFNGSELELLNNETIVFGLKKNGENDVMLNEFKVIINQTDDFNRSGRKSSHTI